MAPPTIGSPADDSDQPAPRARRRNEEWHPVVHTKNKDEQVPTDKIDPTLHMDLLAKVLASKPAGGARNLFEFGPPKLSTVPSPALLAKNEPKITGPRPMGPPPLPPPTPRSVCSTAAPATAATQCVVLRVCLSRQFEPPQRFLYDAYGTRSRSPQRGRSAVG